jgi:excisionase family DNA binding protein
VFLVQYQGIYDKMKLITIKEVSELLNVKPSTVYQWAELKQIPCFKLNGCLRFDIEDIMSWIKSCKKDADSSYNPFVQARGPGREAG